MRSSRPPQRRRWPRPRTQDRSCSRCRQVAFRAPIPDSSRGGGELRRTNAGRLCIDSGKMVASIISDITSAPTPGTSESSGSPVRQVHTLSATSKVLGLGLAPAHSERFAYVRLTDDNLEPAARYLAICADVGLTNAQKAPPNRAFGDTVTQNSRPLSSPSLQCSEHPTRYFNSIVEVHCGGLVIEINSHREQVGIRPKATGVECRMFPR
jgi:hypothetical protein